MSEPETNNCPDPLCLLALDDPTICQHCPKEPQPHPSWGGKRPGAGAPRGNLNRLTDGSQSKLLKRGIARMAEDPELRGVLYIIAHLACEGELPPGTRKMILEITQGGVK